MISKRLAKLEAALGRPVERPVDMRAVHARLAFLTVGAGHKGKTALARFAAALRCSPMRLWRLVATNRRRFARLYGTLERRGRPNITADDVADTVVVEFLSAGFQWRVIDGTLCAVIEWASARCKAPA